MPVFICIVPFRTAAHTLWLAWINSTTHTSNET